MKDPHLAYLCEHTGVTINQVFALVHVYEGPDGNRAQVQNGRYTVDIPTELPPMTLDAQRLAAIWKACAVEPKISTTDTHATISAGRVRGRIPLFDPAGYPRTEPDQPGPINATGVAGVMRKLKPYVATDASRPWATAVGFNLGHAYATNNVVLVRHPIATDLVDGTCIPVASIDAIADRGEPVAVGSTENSATFYFDDGSWVRTSLVSSAWPFATVDGLIEATPAEAWLEVHPELDRLLYTAASLAEERFAIVEFGGDSLRLADDTFHASDLGALPERGRVNAKMAALALEHASHVQWHTPRADVHAFKGDGFQGVFGGTR